MQIRLWASVCVRISWHYCICPFTGHSCHNSLLRCSLHQFRSSAPVSWASASPLMCACVRLCVLVCVCIPALLSQPIANKANSNQPPTPQACTPPCYGAMAQPIMETHSFSRTKANARTLENVQGICGIWHTCISMHTPFIKYNMCNNDATRSHT